MTPDAVADAPTDAFGELPYTVTVQAASRIRSALKILESGGDAGHVTAARVEGGCSTPIDGLDVLSAHRESGRAHRPVRCGRTPDRLAEAQLLHVRQSAHGQVNPVVFADAVSFVRMHMGDGPAAGIENSEYREIAGMRLAPGIRERMSKYITGIGKRTGRIPSFLPPVSGSVRDGARPPSRDPLDRLIRCCDLTAEYNGFYTVLDLTTLKRVVGLLTPRRRGGPTDGDRAWMDAWMGGAPGRYPKPNRDSVYFRCGCMSERVIDTWNLVVLRLPDERTPVPSDRNEGTPDVPDEGRRGRVPEPCGRADGILLPPCQRVSTATTCSSPRGGCQTTSSGA